MACVYCGGTGYLLSLDNRTRVPCPCPDPRTTVDTTTFPSDAKPAAPPLATDSQVAAALKVLEIVPASGNMAGQGVLRDAAVRLLRRHLGDADPPAEPASSSAPRTAAIYPEAHYERNESARRGVEWHLYATSCAGSPIAVLPTRELAEMFLLLVTEP